jgi:hypothetical protein
MIEIALSPAMQRRRSFPLIVRQRRGRSFDGAPPTPHHQRQHMEPHCDAGRIRANHPINPSRRSGSMVSASRKQMRALLKSP